MYIKNYIRYPDHETEYLALQKDEKFKLPFVGKIIAWTLVVAIMVSTSIVLILYGMSFGMIKTYLWLTGIASAFCLGIFIYSPLRIFLSTLFESCCLKKKPSVIKRTVDPSLLKNTFDSMKYNEVMRFRKYNKHLYTPIPVYRLQDRLEDEKYNIELRNLTVDLITYVIFLGAVFYVVLLDKDSLGYYSTRVLENLIVGGSYTNTLPFSKITNYYDFLEYLNYTLLPSLLLNDTYASQFGNYSERIDPSRRPKRSMKSERMKKLPVSKLRKRQIIENLDKLVNELGSEYYERGWTLDSAIKLIGKPRLRQLRVSTESCLESKNIDARNFLCGGELGVINQDNQDYTLAWISTRPKDLTYHEAMPWKYQSSWESVSVPVMGKITSYSGGGYVLNLARTLNASRIILDFMDSFNWVDMRTRVVFVEFTTYSVNTNLFNVVTLIVEKSASGYMIPTYQIYTCKFIFMLAELEIISIIMTILLSLLIFFFVFRESVRMHRTSVWLYIRRVFGVLDLTVILFGILSLLFTSLRALYVRSLLDQLERSDNNEYVSFAIAAYWHTLSTYIEAVLVCLASFKLSRLLTFRVIFFQLHKTLTLCTKHFMVLFFYTFILITGFAFFFYIVVNLYSYAFSSTLLSFSTLIGRSVLPDDASEFEIFENTTWYLGPMFMGLFLLFVTTLFVNLFISVICLYFHEIRSHALVEKYNILKYIKYILTLSQQTDILQLKDKVREQNKDKSSLLRLKGGGNVASTYKDWKRQRNTQKLLHFEEKEEGIIKLSDFVSLKMYSTYKLYGMAPERNHTLRYLTYDQLNDDELTKTVARNIAITSWFLCFLSGRRKMTETTKEWLLSFDSPEQVVNQSRLNEIKKAVEEYGIDHKWVYEDDYDDDDERLYGVSDALLLMSEKLNLILDKKKDFRSDFQCPCSAENINPIRKKQ